LFSDGGVERKWDQEIGCYSAIIPDQRCPGHLLGMRDKGGVEGRWKGLFRVQGSRFKVSDLRFKVQLGTWNLEL
jgi:hypothetical protein